MNIFIIYFTIPYLQAVLLEQKLSYPGMDHKYQEMRAGWGWGLKLIRTLWSSYLPPTRFDIIFGGFDKFVLPLLLALIHGLVSIATIFLYYTLTEIEIILLWSRDLVVIMMAIIVSQMLMTDQISGDDAWI